MKRLLSIALMVLVTLVGMVGVSSAAADKAIQTVITQLQNIQNADHAQPATVNGRVQVKPKMYYLTRDQVNGDQSIDACSTGFHMANLFEILDTSSLQYATGLPGAFSDLGNVDQGDGPRTLDFGWVRTGYASYPDPTRDPYISLNCNSESAPTGAEWGTVARLYDNVTASLMNSEWVGVCARQCSQQFHVWCVENM